MQMAEKIAHSAYSIHFDESSEKLSSDGVPRNRDRVVELVVGICIIAILQALYSLNNAVQLGKARLSQAFTEKTSNEKILLEKLAVEGSMDDANNGVIVSLVDMHNGTVTGLKFYTAGDSLYVVNWKCKQATVQEIVSTLKMLPEASAKKFKGLEPIELPAEYRFKVCQKGAAGA
jgi:hypothetical protein